MTVYLVLSCWIIDILLYFIVSFVGKSFEWKVNKNPAAGNKFQKLQDFEIF